jgi:hypothetical protein
MYNSDKAILRLIDLLIFDNKINFEFEFAKSVGMLPQTVSKIKAGKNHFTPIQIQVICHTYNVNANWIFGKQTNVFNDKNSIEIKDFLMSEKQL